MKLTDKASEIVCKNLRYVYYDENEVVTDEEIIETLPDEWGVAMQSIKEFAQTNQPESDCKCWFDSKRRILSSDCSVHNQPVKDEVREAAERVYDNLCEQIPELGCGIMIVENVEKALNESRNN